MELYLFITISYLNLALHLPYPSSYCHHNFKILSTEPYKAKWVILATTNTYEETYHNNTVLCPLNKLLFTNIPGYKAHVF